MSYYARWLSIATLALAFAGCHGGGSSTLPMMGSNGSLSPQAAGTGTASFTVSVPAPGTAAAIPQSVVVSLVSGNGKMTPLTMNLTASTPGCKTLVGGGLACVATVTAPAGVDTFNIATYGARNGAGATIASAQAKSTVNAAGTRTTACAPTTRDATALQPAK
jgi:hypothetical protein